MLPRPRSPIFVALLIALCASPLPGAHIRGKILRIGYSGSGRDPATRGMDLYRPGYWTPILIELNNDDGDLFEGLLQARQPDRDGDQVVSTLPVSVRGTKNVFIYVPAGPAQNQPFSLRITGPEGGPVAIFDDANKPVSEWKPFPDPRPVQASAQLVLDITHPPLNDLDGLTTYPRLIRELIVARTSPDNLPDSSTGLQMVDFVLWDDADPSQFRDISQQQALVDWVVRGGTLVIGASKNWEMVSKSALAPLLPAPLRGTASGLKLGDLSAELSPLGFDTPILYCPITKADLSPDAISLWPEDPARPDTPIQVASRPWGRGRVVLVATEIKELVHRGGANGVIFLRQLLSLRREAETTERRNSLSPNEPFTAIEEKTGFRVTSGIYFLAAFLFVVVYILTATAGSWNVLQRRKRPQYAWALFAVIAAIASGTSLAAVQVIRGVGHRVQQLSVVDSLAGSDRGVANSYFGLKTASHVSLDLALPRDASRPTETADNPGGLMPLPSSGNSFDLSQYSAAARYQAGGPVGQLWSVPIRATLKQFQGTWAGHLSGRVDASIHRRASGTLTLSLDSWIENRLDTDLTDCYLFVTNINQPKDTDRTASRYNYMQAYPIARLPHGKRLYWKDYLLAQAQEHRKRLVQAGKPALDVNEQNPNWLAPFFKDTQDRWLRESGYSIKGTDVFSNDNDPKLVNDRLEAALLVLTIFSELNLDNAGLGSEDIQRSRGCDLDRSEALTTQTVLFVGFARGEAGPTRLAWRPPGTTSREWRTIEPAEASTMYRFVIPITNSSGPAEK